MNMMCCLHGFWYIFVFIISYDNSIIEFRCFTISECEDPGLLVSDGIGLDTMRSLGINCSGRVLVGSINRNKIRRVWGKEGGSLTPRCLLRRGTGRG